MSILDRSLRLAGFVAVLAGLTAERLVAQEPEPVTMALHWQHQAQFAGYYMALAKDFYRQRHLDVRLLNGGPSVSADRRLRTGEADFASLMLPGAIEHRTRGLPLKLLAQIVSRGNFALVAWRNPPDGPPIDQPADLDGRKVAVWLGDFRTPFLALFAAQGARPVILPQYYTLSLFLHHGVAACSAMRYNEYHILLQSGVPEAELRVFFLRDHGLDLPEDGLYCLEQTWQRRPETCRRFVQATLDGWRYARAHREETLDTVMEYVRQENLPVNRMHMRWMLDEILASVFPAERDGWEFGRLSRQAYDRTCAMLVRHGGLAATPDFSDLVAEEGADEHP